MHINFQQGIITYPTLNNEQHFLIKNGLYVTLDASIDKTDVTFNYKQNSYLLSETESITNAWGPFEDGINYWLYWNIDPNTAERTFGFTTLEPIVSSLAPPAVIGQHWYDTTRHTMFVYSFIGWNEVIRVFAAKYDTTTFYPLGSDIDNPYAGTQIDFNTSILAGRIITDNNRSLKDSTGKIITTEDELFVKDSPTTVIKPETQIIYGTANEHIDSYLVVKFVELGKIELADYNDTETTSIAVATADILNNQTGPVCVKGIISNPNWQFTQPGTDLWISQNGLLTSEDPFTVDPASYPIPKSPVARVISAKVIYFDPYMVSKGPPGDPGPESELASTSIFGITKISVAPVDNLDVVAVGDNDPRLVPYSHPATHPSTMITTDSYGILTEPTLDLQLKQLADRTIDSLSNVVVTSPISTNYLKWNGNNWVNTDISFASTSDRLDTILDVAITAPIEGTLVFNGSKWTDATPTTTLIGDLTGSGIDNINTTLATVNNDVGTFGSETAIASFTVNEKGLITSVAEVPLVASTPTYDAYAIWACGYDTFGQIGTGINGYFNNTSSPLQVGSLTDWVQVSAGKWHVLAVKADNTLWSWGRNFRGQLGDGTTVDKSSPVQIGSLTNWKSVGAGRELSAAIKTDGTLWTWGYNTSGELGIGYAGINYYKSSPVQVGSLTNWKQVVCSDQCAMAIKTDGTLWAWGVNNIGQLGLGFTGNVSSPMQIGTLTNWNHLTLGLTNTAIAIKTDGTLWGWGGNSLGQLGLGDILFRSSPVQIGTLTDWATVSCTGWSHTLAVKTNGTLWGWGMNWDGQLGDGTRTDKSSPIQIGSLTNWSKVSTGIYHSMAVKTDGTLWGWGENWEGMLGDGTTIAKSSPIQVGSLTSWKDVSCGYTSYMLREMPLPISKGGTSSETANDAFNALAPVQTTKAGKFLSTDGTNTDWSPITSNVYGDYSLWMWGSFYFGQPRNDGINSRSSPIQIGTLTDWRENTGIGMGVFYHNIKKDGTLWAWGENWIGMLGDGTRTNRSSPVQIGSLTDWKQVASGNGITAAIKTDGTLWTWGYNWNGELGIGTNLTAHVSSPVQVGSLTNWKYVSAGNNIFAIKTDGTLWGWGGNSDGQLGNGTTIPTSSPIQVGSFTDWKTVAVGYSILAIRENGTMWGWGDSTNGILGNNQTFPDVLVPTQVNNYTNWKSVHTGWFSHTMAIQDDGTLWAWGSNYSGQLGDGTRTDRLVPTKIGNDTNWKAAACGGNGHSMMLKTDGTLWACGYNWSGQLGLGDTLSRSSPVQVGSLNDWYSVNTMTNGTIGIRRGGMIVPIESGGTSNITANDAINALAPDQQGNEGKYLTTNGVNTFWSNVVVPIEAGGTGATTATEAAKNLIIPGANISKNVLYTDGTTVYWVPYSTLVP